MTLCIAWLRKTGTSSEICVAADSCLSGGQRFFAAPKIFPLPRKDSVIACAGATIYSFPIVHHIISAIELNQKLRDRAADLTDVIHLVEDIANRCLQEEREPEYAIPGEGPGFSMLIAGYSWRMRRHLIKTLKFNWNLKKMVASRTSTIKGIPIAVIGDNIGPVRGRIFNYLTAKNIDEDHIDMEPLEVLLQCIEDKSLEYNSISGYPQMVKVYPYPNTLPVGFLHREDGSESFITYYGRPILAYETFPYPIFDLTEMRIKYMYQRNNSEDFRRYHQELNGIEGFK